MAALLLLQEGNWIVSRSVASAEQAFLAAATMTKSEEDQIVDELDREFANKGGLVALLICLGLGGWMMAVTAFSVLTAV